METLYLLEFRKKVSVKKAAIESLAELILKDTTVLAAALENLTEKNETIRYNSYRAIKMITVSKPALFYPYWDFFTAQLESENTYHKLVGIHILADLASIDSENRFEQLFEQYYHLLHHSSMVVVSHVCLASGRLMLFKPDLIRKIEDLLLDIDRFIGKQKHKDLIKSAVLEAFTEARSRTARKKDIRDFASRLLGSSDSPKSRKLARKYLEVPD